MGFVWAYMKGQDSPERPRAHPEPDGLRIGLYERTEHPRAPKSALEGKLSEPETSSISVVDLLEVC